MKTLIIYHKNCFDGICAAWVVKRKFPDAEIVAFNYGDSLHDVLKNSKYRHEKDDKCLFVDISLPRIELEAMATWFGEDNIQVIDHHKTAQAALEGLSYAIFNMNESGASLAWKTFFPDEEMPLLVRYIKDRDLWLFKEEWSEAINSYIQSFPMTIENYDLINNKFIIDRRIRIAELGEQILRYKQTMVEAMCKNVSFNIKPFDNYAPDIRPVIPVVNASILFSEVGNELCKMFPEAPFAAYYFDRLADNTRQWGLRSIGDFDVSEVAKQYGGGGHKNAAGFQEKL